MNNVEHRMCGICNKHVDAWQAYSKTGNHFECQFKNRRRLLPFEKGVMWAVSVMIKNTNDTAMAAQVLREAKFERLDCFELPTKIKKELVKVNLESGIALAGLDE